LLPCAEQHRQSYSQTADFCCLNLLLFFFDIMAGNPTTKQQRIKKEATNPTNFLQKVFNDIRSGSSHIQSVLIGVKYRNCHQILDVYLLFAIWMGQIQSKLIYIFVTY
jgi:hypothetical protein